MITLTPGQLSLPCARGSVTPVIVPPPRQCGSALAAQAEHTEPRLSVSWAPVGVLEAAGRRDVVDAEGGLLPRAVGAGRGRLARADGRGQWARACPTRHGAGRRSRRCGVGSGAARRRGWTRAAA